MESFQVLHETPIFLRDVMKAGEIVSLKRKTQDLIQQLGWRPSLLGWRPLLLKCPLTPGRATDRPRKKASPLAADSAAALESSLPHLWCSRASGDPLDLDE